jgi:hypothetical protein
MSTSFVGLSKKSPLVLSALTVLFLGSCSTLKKTLRANQTGQYRTEQTFAAEQSVVSNETGRSQATTNVDSQLQSDEEETTVVKIYDTSKPVDESTGRPPLLSESATTRRKKEQARQTAIAREEAQSSTDVEFNAMAGSNTSSSGDLSLEVRAKEKRGLNWIQKTLCGLGVITLLWLLWKLLKKRLK